MNPGSRGTRISKTARYQDKLLFLKNLPLSERLESRAADKSVRNLTPLFDSQRCLHQFASSRQSSLGRGEMVLPVRHQQAISAAHPLPVIFIGSSATETDLIMLAIATQSRPSKSMGAKFSEESVEESHVCRSLSHRPDW
jgi:hypothetical protein